jgi:hypothetical protein
MNKKLVLGITASVLAVSLTFGGTMMMFTDTSKTATNVVTLGNAHIMLQEKGGAVIRNGSTVSEAPLGDDTDIDGTDGHTGIDISSYALEPGDKVTKMPRVENKGSVPVYVKVAATLTVGNGDAATLTALNDWLANAKDDQGNALTKAEALAGLFDIDSTNSAWFGDQIKFVPATGTDGKWSLQGAWYYTDANGLAPLAATTGVTSYVFNGVNAPTTRTTALAGYKFSLELTAYAVQSDNNAPDSQDITGWEGLFNADFPAAFTGYNNGTALN